MIKKSNTSWFEVDSVGLSKLMNRGGARAFIVYELVQNAWDEASKKVDVRFEYRKRSKTALLTVKDDNPDGFKTLTHAYTLFAESDKKIDPTKRGRFNVGEKLVLACCICACVRTTRGRRVDFRSDGTRKISNEKLSDRLLNGSSFVGSIKMEEDEYSDICKEVSKLIPPTTVITTFNGIEIKRRNLIVSFNASLPTEISDSEGNLRPVWRTCAINIYEPIGKPTIYEMGIPVVSIDDRYDIDIQQKVPLSIDRTNVTPYYLRKLRTKVLNETYSLLNKEEATQPWVQEASSDKECSARAITKVVELKYGKKRVSFDMSDPEANKLAVSKGYTVVHGGGLSKGQWNNVKDATAIKPAGQVTPSPKPYTQGGRLLSVIPFNKWTVGMHKVEKFAKELAFLLLDKSIHVDITNDRGLHFAATYGPDGHLVLSKWKLGNNFFDTFPHNMNTVLSLLIHEFGHEYSCDHLSSQYHQALCDLGARLALIVVKKPGLFK